MVVTELQPTLAMQVFFYQYLDLPPLPGHVCQKVLAGIDGAQKINQSTDRTLYGNGRSFANGKLERWRMDLPTFQWVRENITDQFKDISVQIMTGQYQGPHTDKLRQFHLYWICDLGGNNVNTIWFQDGDRPVRSNEFVIHHCYDDLREIHRARLDAHRWILFDSRVIHSVEGCGKGLRRGLTIDFDYLPQNIINMMECLP